MKLSYFLIPVTAVMGGLINERTNGCNADNCARAVTGTRLGPATMSVHASDCSSFMKVTTTYGAGITTPTAIPAYASACTVNGNSYSSACSCWGIPVTTIYVSAPLYDDNGADDLPWPKK